MSLNLLCPKLGCIPERQHDEVGEVCTLRSVPRIESWFYHFWVTLDKLLNFSELRFPI